MDDGVVARAQRGDQDAFEALTIANHARLYRVAHGILRDPHLAEDATQQAFLDIWRDIRRLRDPSKFEGWSYRLLVRVCYVEAKRRPDWVADSAMRPGDEPWVADASGMVVARDQLERGFQHLSVDHRTVIVLHHLLDLTLDQVADILDTPRGTVYSRLSRAMEALRLALEAERPTRAPRAMPQEVVR